MGGGAGGERTGIGIALQSKANRLRWIWPRGNFQRWRGSAPGQRSRHASRSFCGGGGVLRGRGCPGMRMPKVPASESVQQNVGGLDRCWKDPASPGVHSSGLAISYSNRGRWGIGGGGGGKTTKSAKLVGGGGDGTEGGGLAVRSPCPLPRPSDTCRETQAQSTGRSGKKWGRGSAAKLWFLRNRGSATPTGWEAARGLSDCGHLPKR